MGWYVKLRERKLGREGKYDLKAGSNPGTSYPHLIMVVFSPLVGERGHRGQGWWIINNYSTSAPWI